MLQNRYLSKKGSRLGMADIGSDVLRQAGNATPRAISPPPSPSGMVTTTATHH